MPKAGALACSKCGLKATHVPLKLTEKQDHKDKKTLEIVDESVGQSLPLGDAKCRKCGHVKAHFWDQQTRSADEPATRFFKCEQCKHTWRDNAGDGSFGNVWIKSIR